MGKLGNFARVMLFAGLGVFIVGICAGFGSLLLRWGDLGLLALAPLILGGVMAFTGIFATFISESKRSRESID
jgi:hypothetical protein